MGRRGGPGPIFLRPKDDPNDDDWPPGVSDSEPDPCAGRPHVRAPLVAAQLHLQLGREEFDCPSETDRQLIEQAVRSQFSPSIPDADVKVRCANRLLTIAVWGSWNASNACEQQARERGIKALDLIEERENFGFFLSASFVSQQAHQAFAAAPKQLSTNGAPSYYGPIHLTGLSVRFEANKVKTRITGYDDQPWPHVDFILTVTDVIHDDLACTTSKDLETPGQWNAILAAILLGRATCFMPWLFPLTFFVIYSDLDAAVNQPGYDGEGGVGYRALGLVPADVPLLNRSKLEMSYRRARVTTGGMFFGGLALPNKREPGVSITGAERLMVADNASATFAYFRVITEDTFGTLSVNWHTATGITIENPSAVRTKIAFERGNNTPASSPFTRTIRVTVADQDGFAETATLDVKITVVEKDVLPAVCRRKPYLPQCQV